MLAAFSVPLLLLLATMGLVAMQQRAVRGVIEAVETRESTRVADELVRELLVLTSSGETHDDGQLTTYWDELRYALESAAERTRGLDGFDERSDEIEQSWQIAEAAFREYRSEPDEIQALYLEDALAGLSELLNVISIEVRNRQILALEEERSLRNLPVRFGSAMGLLALAGSGTFAWWFARRIVRPLDELADASDRIADGDLAVQVERSGIPEVDRLGDSFRSMVGSLRELLGQIREGRTSLGTTADSISRAIREAVSRADEQARTVEQASLSIEQMIGSIGSVAKGTSRLAESAREASGSMQEMERTMESATQGATQLQGEIETTASSVVGLQSSMVSVEQQAQSLGEAAAATTRSIESIRVAVARIDAGALESSELARTATRVADDGLDAMRRAQEGIQSVESSFQRIDASVSSLATSSRTVSDILEVIGDIATQSQMLSLNAAIIAAQAGDQGRAFGVVAKEVAELAARSAQCVRDVGERVGEIGRGIDSSVRAAQEGAAQVGRGTKLVHQAAASLGEMAAQARNSEERADDIVRVVSESRDAVETVAKEAARTAAAATTVSRATTEQQETGVAMLDSIQRIRDLSHEASLTAEAQRSETLRLSEHAGSVAERTAAIDKETAEQRVQADEIELALEVFRRAATEWSSHVASLDEAMGLLLADSDALGEQVERFRGAGSGRPRPPIT